MKRAILLTLCLTLLLPSCIKTEVINAPIEKADTVLMRKPHKPVSPPIESDTTRVQIGFNPSVEDWEGTDVDM